MQGQVQSRTFLWMWIVWCEFHKWNVPCLHQDRARTHGTWIPAWTERLFIASHEASALSHQFEIVWRITLSRWGTHRHCRIIAFSSIRDCVTHRVIALGTHLEFAIGWCDVGWCDVGRIFEFPANVRGYAISECFDACWNWNVWAMRNCHW